MTLYLLKSASADVSFHTNNSKMPNFLVATLLSQMSDICCAFVSLYNKLYRMHDTYIKIQKILYLLSLLYAFLYNRYELSDVMNYVINFVVLLTVHLSIILAIDRLDAQILVL